MEDLQEESFVSRMSERARSLLSDQARSIFAADTPIFQLLGYLVFLYITFYVITFYIGPILFGRGPHYPYKRSLDVQGLPQQMLMVDPMNAAQLTQNVHTALESQNLG